MKLFWATSPQVHAALQELSRSAAIIIPPNLGNRYSLFEQIVLYNRYLYDLKIVICKWNILKGYDIEENLYLSEGKIHRNAYRLNKGTLRCSRMMRSWGRGVGFEHARLNSCKSNLNREPSSTCCITIG